MSRLLAALGSLLVALAFSSNGWAAQDDVFVVPRVPVQASGESATAAKQSAQMQGRRRAVDILLRRLTVESDWDYLPRLVRGEPASASGDPSLGKTPISLADSTLEALESSFEVYSEKSSATTYRAFITYRFKPDAVRRLLKNARIPYSETQTRKALVIPVLEMDRGSYLWEANNPWMAAWKSRPYLNELTPMAAPLGDVEDASSITAQQALALDPVKLAAMADRYNVSQVIVAHARLRQSGGQDQLTVKLINGYRETDAPAPDAEIDPTLVNYQGGEAPTVGGTRDIAPAQVGEVLAQAVFADASGNFPALADRAIEGAIAKYAGAWKSRTLIDHSHEGILETTAFFESLADWTKIRAGLLATPLVGSVQVFALSPRGAEMRLKVFGDPQRLAVAMENYGVTFWTEDNRRWFLATPSRAGQLRGSSALRRVYSDGNYNREDPAAPRIDNAIEGPAPATPEDKIAQPQ